MSWFFFEKILKKKENKNSWNKIKIVRLRSLLSCLVQHDTVYSSDFLDLTDESSGTNVTICPLLVGNMVSN